MCVYIYIYIVYIYIYIHTHIAAGVAATKALFEPNAFPDVGFMGNSCLPNSTMTTSAPTSFAYYRSSTTCCVLLFIVFFAGTPIFCRIASVSALADRPGAREYYY